MANDLQTLAMIMMTKKNEYVPVMTGNTSLQSLKVASFDDKEIVLTVNAPFVDLKHWRKSGKIPYANIIYTGAIINGKTDYAMWVNKKGAWGKRNKSQYWVNRLCYYAVLDFAKTLGNDVEIINELPLEK